MMGVWQPMTNLRDYVSQNPPWVTFFLCLLSLAVSFTCLSSYTFTNTLPNPDTATVRTRSPCAKETWLHLVLMCKLYMLFFPQDWNRLLSSLSQFQLCVKANASSSEPVSPVPSPLMDRDTSVDSTGTPSVTSLRLKVPLTVTTTSNSGPLKDLCLHTTMRAKQLNLGGLFCSEMDLLWDSVSKSVCIMTNSHPLWIVLLLRRRAC